MWPHQNENHEKTENLEKPKLESQRKAQKCKWMCKELGEVRECKNGDGVIEGGQSERPSAKCASALFKRPVPEGEQPSSSSIMQSMKANEGPMKEQDRNLLGS